MISTTTALNNINSFKLFEGLSEKQLETFTNISEEISFKKYSHIYQENENTDTLYFLLEGRVKLCTYNNGNKELIKTILYPTDLFGEESILNIKSREDFAIAMDKKVRVLAVNSIEFRRFLCQNPDISFEITGKIGTKLKNAEKRIENFIFKNARTRIIDFLKEMAVKQGQPIGFEILIKNFLTHNEIASLIGTSRQTVTIVLSELKKDNKIHIDRKNVLVRDINNLQ